MYYRPQHVCLLFGVAPETARIWAMEFAEYLSPTATPGKNKHRLFTEEDMQVFALVNELKGQGLTYTDIHVSLKAGQRGDPPVLAAADVQALVTSDQERQLSLENHRLEQALRKALEELKQVEALQIDLQQTKEQNIRLETEVRVIKEQQERLEQRIAELSRELGREYAQGFTDALREKGDLPEK